MIRCWIILIILGGLGCKTITEDHKPNVLFIYLDDFGWKDCGYMGSDFYETPHIDRLAARGMHFTNAYSAAANCAPARACLFAGQYTPRHEIYNVGTGPRGKAEHRRLKHIPGVDTLPSNIKTWAHSAQEAGYKTATIGKWHLSKNPIPYGFDVNIGGTHSGSPPKGYYPPHPKAPGLEVAPKNEYLTDRLTMEALQFIVKNKERPWLLYLTHFAVHTPIQAKKELLTKYQTKTPGSLHNNAAMATMIQSVDDGIGQIVSTLEELGLSDNTIILFYSDNGGYAQGTDMEPLRGHKGTYYEGGIRVPFFVTWPKVIRAGQKSEIVMTGVDIYPTLCEMIGAKLPANQTLDGINLVPILKGAESIVDRPVFWHFPAYLQAGNYVSDEPRDPIFRTRPCSIVRHGNWKLHHYYEDGGLELYDLSKDIGEKQNLASINPEKAQELYSILQQWCEELNAPIPSEPNPDFNSEAHAKALQQAMEKLQ